MADPLPQHLLDILQAKKDRRLCVVGPCQVETPPRVRQTIRMRMCDDHMKQYGFDPGEWKADQ